NPQLLEVMSQDLGNTPSGLSHNFAYAALAVGTNTLPTAVRLVDNAHNSAGTGPEALYVNTLVVTAGSTLDLNGHHLYARQAQVAGTVVNGSVTLLGDGGPLNLNSAAPGSISPAGDVDDWTFFARAGQVVTVTVHTGSGGMPAPVAPALNFAQLSLL